MNGIGDFVASIKETQRLAAQIMAELKGDSPGHPFRGNQYTEGGGVLIRSGSESDFARALLIKTRAETGGASGVIRASHTHSIEHAIEQRKRGGVDVMPRVIEGLVNGAREDGLSDEQIQEVAARFKGDTPGHPFRGNQYDGGSGKAESISGIDYAEKIGSNIPKEHLKLIKNVSNEDSSSRSQNQSGNIVMRGSDDIQRTFAHEVGHSVLMMSPDKQHIEKVVFNTPQAKMLAKRGGKWASYEHLTHELFSEMYADKYTGRGRVKIDKNVSDAIDDMRMP